MYRASYDAEVVDLNATTKEAAIAEARELVQAIVAPGCSYEVLVFAQSETHEITDGWTITVAGPTTETLAIAEHLEVKCDAAFEAACRERGWIVTGPSGRDQVQWDLVGPPAWVKRDMVRRAGN